jgi:hypothetical protein
LAEVLKASYSKTNSEQNDLDLNNEAEDKGRIEIKAEESLKTGRVRDIESW